MNKKVCISVLAVAVVAVTIILVMRSRNKKLVDKVTLKVTPSSTPTDDTKQSSACGCGE